VLSSLKSGIDLRKSGDADGARELVLSGVGKRLMDDLRNFIDEMESEENHLLKQRSVAASASGRNSFLTHLTANLIACALLLLISYIVIHDVTARKRAEGALRQQREWLQVTLSSIGDAVIATDMNGTVTFLNPVAQALTGWKHEEAVGQPVREVFNIVNEWTRKTVENPALRAIKKGVLSVWLTTRC